MLMARLDSARRVLSHSGQKHGFAVDGIHSVSSFCVGKSRVSCFVSRILHITEVAW